MFKITICLCYCIGLSLVCIIFMLFKLKGRVRKHHTIVLIQNNICMKGINVRRIVFKKMYGTMNSLLLLL